MYEHSKTNLFFVAVLYLLAEDFILKISSGFCGAKSSTAQFPTVPSGARYFIDKVTVVCKKRFAKVWSTSCYKVLFTIKVWFKICRTCQHLIYQAICVQVEWNTKGTEERVVVNSVTSCSCGWKHVWEVWRYRLFGDIEVWRYRLYTHKNHFLLDNLT